MNSPAYVNITDAVKLFFKNYANFSGRSTRSEYWWVTLFLFIIGLVFGGLINAVPFFKIIYYIIYIAIIIPSLSLGVRRLHDTGKSGFWLFIGLIPLVGEIILIVFFCMPSVNDNQWGESADSKLFF